MEADKNILGATKVAFSHVMWVLKRVLFGYES